MTDKFTKSQHLSLFVRDLKPHPEVQREFKPGWARQLRDDFDPDKFGEIAVVKQEVKGIVSYLVFDGQHRTWAAREVLGENQRVPCIVYTDMPIERQAELFLGRSNSKSLRALDKFKMAVKAKRPVQTRINHIVTGMGLKIDHYYGAGTVRSVAALEKVFERWGEDTLIRTISVVRAAWSKEAEAYDGVIIRAIGYLLYHFDAEIEDSELSRKLARAGGPNRMIGSARDHSKTMGIAVERAAAEWALNLYNKGRRTSPLVFAPKATNGAGQAMHVH
jgi:hypothetical protein